MGEGKTKNAKGKRKEAGESTFFLFSFSFFVGLPSAGARLHRALARTPTPLLAGLLIVGDALDVLGQTFFLARLLETPQQLLGRLVASTLDLDHGTCLCT